MLLVLFTLTGTQETDIIISNSNALNEMLCSNISTQLSNNLVLKLNMSSYELYQIDGYCIVQNINNLTVQGVNGNSTIRRVPVGSPGSGFGFINLPIYYWQMFISMVVEVLFQALLLEVSIILILIFYINKEQY